jgi:hypothetical protein
LPLLEREVDTSVEFAPAEPLYRRISAAELTGGEIDPSRFNSVSFDKSIEGAPSVLRGRFAEPRDVLHPHCADGRDVTHFLIYFIFVQDLPDVIKSDDGKEFAFFPSHRPEPTCGAHSVIACCIAGDPARGYSKPTRPVRNQLRAKLAAKLQPFANET